MRMGASFVIGDANGADRAVQQFLAERSYPNVVVYCGQECRNNLGNWPVRQAGAAKERAMAADAQGGLMLWDGKGPEALAGARLLLGARKRTLLYLSTGKSFHQFTTEAEMAEFLASR